MNSSRYGSSARATCTASPGVSHGGPCRSIMMSMSSPTASRNSATMRTGSKTPPRVTVDADAIADLAAEQVPHRRAKRLALDVPQRQVDAGDRAGADGARHSVTHDRRIHLLPEPLEVSRVFADQQ